MSPATSAWWRTTAEAGGGAPGQRRADGLRAKYPSGELARTVWRELPEYMVPAAYVTLDALPLTPNGKLDRRALPAPEGSAYGARVYEAPVGEIETALAQIWSEVLQLERVGRQDHFFELGGHSLLAVKLMERMRQQSLHADIRTLFAQPTLAALARAVQQAEDGGHVEVSVPPNGIPADCQAITPEMLPLIQLSAVQIEQIVAAVPGGAANIQDIYPLAPLQEGILFHYLLEKEARSLPAGEYVGLRYARASGVVRGRIAAGRGPS